MSKINPKQAYAKKIIDRFEGVGEVLAAEQTQTASILNFRILTDGSLEKRNGWRLHSSFASEEILGVWRGSLSGNDLFIIVTRDEIYRVQDGVARVTAVMPYTITDRVSLFSYQDHLFLIDGVSIRVWDWELGCFVAAEGYVPLIGIGWHPQTMGKTHEALNLLNNHARVQYTNTTGESVYHLPLIASSIDRVRVDGVETKDYSFTKFTNQIQINKICTSVEIAFSFSPLTVHHTNLLHSTIAFCDFFGSKEKLLLSGSEKGQLVYTAQEVSETMLTSSKACYSNSDPLYFCENGILIVGDLTHPATSFTRQRDRVIATSELSVFSIQPSTLDSEAYARPLHIGMGSLARGLNVNANGDPILINENGIFQIHSAYNEPDNFITKRISEGIPELESEEFARQVTVGFDSIHNELWFRNVTDENGVVWVYGLSTKQWYCFDGIPADGFCPINRNLGFFTAGELCVFDESMTTDDGVPIVSSYETAYLSLSEPEIAKRGLRVSVKAEHGGNPLSLRLESETRCRSISLSAPISSVPTLFDRRAAIGRFHFLRVTIFDRGYARSRIYRLALYANL